MNLVQTSVSNAFSWLSSALRAVFPRKGEVYTGTAQTVHLSLFVGGIVVFLLSASKNKSVEMLGAAAKDRKNMNYAINRRMVLSSLPISELVDKTKLRNVKIVEGYNSNARGELLFYRCFIPKHNEKGSFLFLINGYAAGIEQLHYAMGVELANSGYVAFTYDHHGHGRSDGLWVYIHDFDHLVDDACLMAEFAKRQFGRANMNYFLHGLSMGGAVAIMVSMQSHEELSARSLKHSNGKGEEEEEMDTNNDTEKTTEKNWLQRWDGCILSAPMIGMGPSLYSPRIVVRLLYNVLRHLFPTAPIPSDGVDRSALCSRDNRVVECFRSSPVRYVGGFRYQTAQSMWNACDFISKNLSRVSIPLLILHGDADELTPCHMSEKLYKEASSKDKELKLFKGGYHVLSGDICKDEVYQTYLEWLQQRSPRQVAQS